MSKGISNSEEQEIAQGRYRNQYLIYNRKSTDDTDNQKNSITYQTSENTRFALREQLLIAPVTLQGLATNGIISERHSGFKEDVELRFGEGHTVQYRVERPKFHRLVKMLSEGYFRGVIFLCWDRASRNKGDDTLLRKLMKGGVDVRFTLAQYEKTSAGELHMDIDGMFAEHHSRVTREKVTITMRNARARGLCTHKAPVGYLNLGSMEHKPLDPERAPIVRRLFELAATANWSLADLARWAIDQGFTMPPVRRRRTQDEIQAEEGEDVRRDIQPIAHLPTFNSIHKILTNPTYTGRTINENGIWTPSASLEAIVDEQIFDRVQQQLRSKNKSAHYLTLLDHPLRRLIRCGLCRRVYTPYVQKGITYYGARCQKDCGNSARSVNFQFLSERIRSVICNLSFTEPELAEIDEQLNTRIALAETKRLKEGESLDQHKRQTSERLSYLVTNKLSLLRAGAYTPETIAAEEAGLRIDLDTLTQAGGSLQASLREAVEDARKLSELLKESLIHYDFATPHEKDRIARTIFSELALTESSVDYQCKSGFAALQGRFVASSEPTGWLSELQRDHSSILASSDILKTALAERARSANDEGFDADTPLLLAA